ncbi:band 4.1-like protein 2 isoform X2 [Neopelma chrysocephalum]|nr:band 4.1-like protein 2 isoform X2 [Neopelma chrysocephalum]XP_027546829.1 band 4.1-like protein 2 isoform X2 [Neopelma chrysocephalum]XP_027546840.1 band 4.1-like protein 2 isoform X2 [Neopelma chrysocephalum]XP_027546848.1 band 4.1-like protein 2 isoform X2 [Neopelma chrysocephalum]XP_027546856.1 band 4.1-like protein 2 isoform X2 [Neopelma chrysocephalum]XP_027546864.1 band 4.1-like protein 2 isoform X2 [Neopelma chrysocephalum]XP_027546870.1 band 4.1-like protein 2 isoform X2 [Neopelma
MTTEVGSETEVKKDSEQLGPDKAKDKPEEASETPENQKSKEASSEEAQDSSLPEPTSQSSPSSQKKQKASPESKGISRFLPPWLKKQKSYTLAEPKDEPKKKTTGDEQVIEESESQIPEGVAQPRKSLEEAAENHHNAKADDKEKQSVSSAETPQLVKEDGKEMEVEKVAEKKEENEEEKEKRETKEVQTAEIKTDDIPQKSPKKTKTVQCKVMLLDGTEYSCDLEKRAKGQVLFDKVCEHLNLLEKDYFGLLFYETSEQKNWLDPSKEIKRQIRSLPWIFTFNVKFYPPDPSQLTEDITRYFLCLQLRQDIVSGRLPCSFVTHALLGSYTLQAELGDHDPEEHRSDYISEFQFAPNQTQEMEEKVAELHKTHRGLTPAQADSQFLENAKRLSMYGVDLHHAKDSEGVDIMLGVCANGLLIYKDRLRINRFAWPKILKISYKRSNFYIKVRPAELEQFESTIGFKLPNHRAAKRLWKVCVEHHTFFRLVSPEQPPKAKFLTLGSKFRYSGRTQAQTRQASNLIDRPAPYFERTSSKRVSRSLDGAPMGISDQSLRDFSAAGGQTAGDKIIDTEAAGQANLKEGGREEDGSPVKTPQLELTQDGKINSLRVDGENIYVRHSNLMLEDLDKTQDDLLKHQASISELKRNFMESTPEPRPNEWEKRRITPLSLQTQGKKGDHIFQVKTLPGKEKQWIAMPWIGGAKPEETDKSLEEEITSILFSKEGFGATTRGPFAAASPGPAEGAAGEQTGASAAAAPPPQRHASRAEGPCTGVSDADKSSHETLDIVEEKKQAEFGIEETVVVDETNKGKMQVATDAGETCKVEHLSKKDSSSFPSDSSSSSSSSESEDEEVGEYQPHHRAIEEVIREEQEEEEDMKRKEHEEKIQHVEATPEGSKLNVPVEHTQVTPEDLVQKNTVTVATEEKKLSEQIKQDLGQEKEEEQLKLNGDVSHVDIDVAPQVICCSEPPVVKTEMVTISDATQRTEISTKEIPIVQTETKTITYESSQLDGSAGGDAGVLVSAQTITSESVSTTTTTHITKMVKGGVSETRIEKRIVITGDADIDHDEALAQAIKEAKEQHPDMSVTRVVVHKETEIAEEDEE